MIDAKTLDYTFDEESGFGEPEVKAAPSLTALQKLGLALVGLGLLSLAVQVFAGFGNGTWLGLGTSFGALVLGAIVTFWAGYKDTIPGIKHNGTWFGSLTGRGAFAWVAGIFMTGFYVLLYWYPEYLGYQQAVWANGARG